MECSMTLVPVHYGKGVCLTRGFLPDVLGFGAKVPCLFRMTNPSSNAQPKTIFEDAANTFMATCPLPYENSCCISIPLFVEMQTAASRLCTWFVINE